MSNFVSDSYTDGSGTVLASHTGETGATWTQHGSYAGAAAISDANRCRSNTSGNALYYASGTPATAEYDVTTDLIPKSNVGTSGVCGRQDVSADTGYQAVFISGTGWRLRKIVASTLTTLGTDSTTNGTSLTVDATYALKLEIRAAAKKLYVAGSALLTSADDVITGAGKAGVRFTAGNSNSTGYHLDNFAAVDVAGGTAGALIRRLICSAGE